MSNATILFFVYLQFFSLFAYEPTENICKIDGNQFPLFSDLLVDGGDIIGNGGDSVYCEESSKNDFQGYYSLDYLLTYKTVNDNKDIVQFYNWHDSIARIEKILFEKHPDLHFSFSQFIKHLDNFFDPSLDKVWNEASFGLVDIKDERVIKKIPANCYKSFSEGKIQIIQSVIRIQRPDQVVYEFDPAVYKEFSELAPLQFSFLLVHEWLWDLTKDVRLIRDVNRLLHSERVDSYNAEQLQNTIEKMGLLLRSKSLINTCSKTRAIRDYITYKIGKPCHEVKLDDLLHHGSGDLHSVPRIIIENKNIGALKFDDLSGLGDVYEIIITHAGLQHIYKHQFSDMPDLVKLNFSNNNIRSIDFIRNSRHQQIYYINFNNNLIKEIPREVLLPKFGEHASGNRDIFFANNKITRIPEIENIKDQKKQIMRSRFFWKSHKGPTK